MAVYIPLLGRLSLNDYKRILLTCLVLLADVTLRLFLFLVPKQLQNWLDRSHSRFVPLRILRGYNEEDTKHALVQLTTVRQMAEYWGLNFEEFVVPTADGYFLALHRLRPKATTSKGVVLMWHGFMMTSEVWLAHPNRESNLAITLVERGYDVWLANVRGNKYSIKHSKYKYNDTEFWDYSLDEHALVDLPETIDFVLNKTGAKTLSYIGFSQGTTICFAGLSLREDLRRKINCFVALAPSMTPQGLSNSFISSIIRSSPELIFLLFGRRSLLSSVTYYTEVLSPRFFVHLIDSAVALLFSWTSNTMSLVTKISTYQHLYSTCSVKVMVHWFQVIRNRRFAMFDDDISRVVNISSKDSEDMIMVDDELRETVVLSDRRPRTIFQRQPLVTHITPRFPTQQIDQVPIAAFYGGVDTLLDMKALLNGLKAKQIRAPVYLDKTMTPRQIKSQVIRDRLDNADANKDDSPLVFLKCIPWYEHLCFLWGDEAKDVFHPDIIRILDQFNSE